MRQITVDEAEQASRDAAWNRAATLWRALSDQDPAAVRPALEWSLACQKSGDADGVLLACDRLLALAPRHRTALFRRAVALERKAHTSAAAWAWFLAARRLPNDEVPLTRLCRLFRRAGRKRAAALTALRLWRLDHTDETAATLAFTCLDDEADCLRLAPLWQDRLERAAQTPGFDTAALSLPSPRLLRALSHNGAEETLRRLADTIIALVPGHAPARRHLAEVHESAGHLAQAESHLRLRVAHDPDPAAARWALVRFHDRHGNWAAAADALGPLSRGPNADPDAMLRRIDRLSRAGQNAAAAAEAQTACRRWPDREAFWTRRLKIARARGAHADHARTAQDGLPHHPGSRLLLKASARLHWSNAAWEAAYDAWDALSHGDRDADAGLLAARCLVHMGRLEAAAERFAHLLDLHPDTVEAARRLFHTLRRLHRYSQAEDACHHWLALRPTDLQAWAARADLMIRQGRLADAETLRRQAEEALPGNADTWIALADMARRCGHAHDETRCLALALEAGAAVAVSRHHHRAGRVGAAMLVLRTAANTPEARAERDTLAATLRTLGFPDIPDATTLQTLTLPGAAIPALLEHAPPPENRPHGGIVLAARSLGAGGAERQVSVTLRGLAAKGLSDLHLLTGRLDGTDERAFYAPLLDDLPVTLHHPDPSAGPDGAAGVQALLDLCPASFRRDVLAHLSSFQRLRPALVHVWQDGLNITGGLAAVLAGVPRVVLSARTLPPVHPIQARRAAPYLREGYRTLLARPAVRLCVNSHAGAAAYAAWLDLPPSRLDVIHNGLDRTWLDVDDAPMPPPPPIPPEAPVIGTVFRFVWQKNPALWLDTAARVAARRPDCHFLLVGDGPGRTDFAQAVDAAGLSSRVHLIGRVAAVTPWYARMTLFLMTSVVEGLPNAAMEAQANGVPVIATRAGGTAETLLDGTTGWTVPLPPDPDAPLDAVADALAERLLWCFDHPEWVAQARRRARTQIDERFAVGTMMDRTLALYGAARETPTQEITPCAG
jgi:glycosyltransferase involved in cell wall biosynthesis/tetratricopeptide (TPR) repeat protein